MTTPPRVEDTHQVVRGLCCLSSSDPPQTTIPDRACQKPRVGKIQWLVPELTLWLHFFHFCF